MDKKQPDPWAEGGVGVEQAARFLGIKKTKLYELLDAGAVVSSKVGTRRVVSRVSLKALLAKGSTANGEAS